MVYILGITDLGINLPVLLGQLLSFTLLLIVMRLFVYKPVLNMLDERRERIREGLSAAERGREQAAEANLAAQAQIETARREGQGIVAQAQQQQEAMLERARGEIQLERDNAIAELRREFADLTIAAAEKVIGQSLDRTAHQRLIEQALSDSSFRED